jgi:Spx/MgsR family transcriptional regulator
VFIVLIPGAIVAHMVHHHGMSNAHPITLYGIPNCDTVKKARAWLDEHQVAHQFHDFKKQGVPPAELDRWLAAVGWEKVLNRKGTMWRKLDPAQQAAVTDAASARALMLEVPSVIKRPVMAWADGRHTVGFDAADWGARIGL